MLHIGRTQNAVSSHKHRFRPFHRPRRPLGYSSTLFSDLGTRRRWGVSVMPRSLSTPGKDPVPIVQEAGWAPGPVWRGAENLAHTGIRSPNRQARSSVATPTELPGPQSQIYTCLNKANCKSSDVPTTVLNKLHSSQHVAPQQLVSSYRHSCCNA
jgi:hypothetical protein